MTYLITVADKETGGVLSETRTGSLNLAVDFKNKFLELGYVVTITEESA